MRVTRTRIVEVAPEEDSDLTVYHGDLGFADPNAPGALSALIAAVSLKEVTRIASRKGYRLRGYWSEEQDPDKIALAQSRPNTLYTAKRPGVKASAYTPH